MSNTAYETYKKQEENLLNNHPGEYIWIIGEEIKEINSNLTDLLQKAEKDKTNPQNTIVRRIEKYPTVAYDG